MSTTFEIGPRNLAIVPIAELKYLAERDMFFPPEVTAALQQAVQFIEQLMLAQSQTDKQLIIPEAVHGVVSFLNYCMEQGEAGKELAYSLVPPFDPRTLPAETAVDGESILDDWRIEHLADNKNFVEIVWPEIVAATSEGRGLVVPLLGAMYSAKSGFIFELIDKLEVNPEIGIRPFATLEGSANVSFYTSAALNEHRIKSRLHEQEIPVEPLTLEGLVDIADGETVPRMLVIDEITFIQFPNKEQFADDANTDNAESGVRTENPANRFRHTPISERANLIAEALRKLKQRGVIVIATGLDSDYRGFEFDAVNAIRTTTECYQHAQLQPMSFCAYRNGGGLVKVAKDAYLTTRFLKSGIVDFGVFPVPVSKEKNVVDYYAVAGNRHYWQQLAQIDPEVYQILRHQFPLGPDEMALELYIGNLPQAEA